MFDLISQILRRCLLTTLVVVPVWLYAQGTDYKFVQFDTKRGLSHNQVNCFLKDRQGFLWVGTQVGLNRFDGYSFKVFRKDANDQTTLSNDYVYNLLEDPLGRIWVSDHNDFTVYDPNKERFYRDADSCARQLGLPNASLTIFLKSKTGDYWINHTQIGLCQYQTRKGVLVKFNHIPLDTATLRAEQIADLREDSKGFLWIIHRNGILERLNPETQKVVFRSYYLQYRYAGESFDYKLFIDKEDDLWIYSDDQKGGQYYHVNTLTFLPFHTESSWPRLRSNIIRGIIQDKEGIIWIATDHGGVTLVNKKNRSVQHLLHDPGNENSLSQNSAISIYQDPVGAILIGTHKRGFNLYHKNIFKFPLYRHLPSNAGSLPVDDINDFAEDHLGNIWIGTNGGGLFYFDRKANRYLQYRNDPDSPNSLSDNVVVSLCMDREQNLWVGTYGGGLDCFDGHKFTHYKHDPANPNSISDDRVWEIYEDSRQNLWVGTLRGGLNLFDRSRKTFRHYRSQDANSIQSEYISALLEDRDGNLWIGTERGIDVLEQRSGLFMHYENDPLRQNSLSNNTITSIAEDADGNIWIATWHGLNLFDKKNKTFRSFGKTNGFIDDVIISLVVDKNKGIWMGTPNGLVNMVMTTGAKKEVKDLFVSNFNEFDGLQGREFNEDAAGKTRLGELLFGGPNGFNLIYPEKIDGNPGEMNVLLTDFQVFNRSIRPQELVGGKVILKNAIFETKELTLDQSQNVFSIGFAALDFFHPEKNKYYYQLEGFNKDWFLADNNSRKVTYTNLDPGEYTFRVRVVNEEGVSREAAPLKIFITPPSWRSTPAKALYLILFIAGLFLARWIILDRERMKFRLDQERIEAQRTHELDSLKIKFLTNISYEFRTPLTLILTPVEALLQSAKEEEEKAHLALIHRNAKKLLNLVNQLLDFKRLQVEETKFLPARGDIVSFVRDITHSFSDVSGKKDIKIAFDAEMPSLQMIFDQDKLSRVMYNLLSNAVKFTPGKGNIFVTIGRRRQEGSTMPEALEIRVSDNGIGIPKQAQNKIFKRFYQHSLPGSMVNQGTGIGLAIANEFIRLHQGSIQVESEENKGSVFVIRLPVQPMEPHLEDATGIPAAAVLQNRLHIEVTPKDIKITSLDEQLIKNAIELVEQNIANAEFRVEDLSHALAMSRVHLYKKLLALTGKTPIEFIRAIRLKRAAQLLEKSQLTVAEVAYKVGFNNPKYFARYFKQEFDLLPKSYQKKFRNLL